jgi:spore maturation protein CgeB
LTSFSVADVHAGWVEGLRSLGQEVHEYNLDDRLQFYTAALFEADQRGPNGAVMLKRALEYPQAVDLALNGLMAACYRLWPDVLLVVSGLFADHRMLDCIRSRGTRVAVVHTEEPYEHPRQLGLAAHADLNLVNDPTHLDAYRSVAPTVYLPHAYRPALHRPQPAATFLASDFCFVGTGYPSRREFFEQVDWTGLTVRMAGNWMGTPEGSPLRRYLFGDVDLCMPNGDVARMYASTCMSANLYRREADQPEFVAGWSMSPREVELAAMGVPFLREPRGEGDAVLPMLPTFAGPDDFGETLRWWLAHPDDRAEAAGKARAAVADWTFEARARELLRLLGA